MVLFMFVFKSIQHLFINQGRLQNKKGDIIAQLTKEK